MTHHFPQDAGLGDRWLADRCRPDQRRGLFAGGRSAGHRRHLHLLEPALGLRSLALQALELARHPGPLIPSGLRPLGRIDQEVVQQLPATDQQVRHPGARQPWLCHKVTRQPPIARSISASSRQMLRTIASVLSRGVGRGGFCMGGTLA